MNNILRGVGFEPTRANTDDLKSSPLDHSGNHAKLLTFFLKQIIHSISIFLILPNSYDAHDYNCQSKTLTKFKFILMLIYFFC